MPTGINGLTSFRHNSSLHAFLPATYCYIIWLYSEHLITCIVQNAHNCLHLASYHCRKLNTEKKITQSGNSYPNKLTSFQEYFLIKISSCISQNTCRTLSFYLHIKRYTAAYTGNMYEFIIISSFYSFYESLSMQIFVWWQIKQINQTNKWRGSQGINKRKPDRGLLGKVNAVNRRREKDGWCCHKWISEWIREK